MGIAGTFVALERGAHRTLDRVRVVLTAAVTYITLVAGAVQIIVAQLGEEWPPVAEYGGHALTILAAAVLIIRRVTPSEYKGLLQPDGYFKAEGANVNLEEIIGEWAIYSDGPAELDYEDPASLDDDE